jgi:hypothetical protein
MEIDVMASKVIQLRSEGKPKMKLNMHSNHTGEKDSVKTVERNKCQSSFFGSGEYKEKMRTATIWRVAPFVDFAYEL